MKKLSLLVFILFITITAYSAYLRNVPVDLKQTDGNVVHCFISGDEFHRRVHDKDNYTIVQNPSTGYYVYALKKDDELVPSEYVVGESDPKHLLLESNIDIPVQQMEQKRTEMLKSAKMVTEAPTKGDFNNIVISIRFSDQQPTTLKLQDYDNKFNSATGVSLKSYYKEVSNSQLNVNSNFYPQPQNQTVLEYQDSHPRAYYTMYDNITNPSGYIAGQWMDREFKLIKSAVESVRSQIVNSQIDVDKNNDGFVDNIVFVIQGNLDTWGEILWPEHRPMVNSQIFIGNKQINQYNKQLSTYFNGEVICHEFFHSLGAPDLYRYTNKEIDPIGAWDIMGITGAQHMTTFMKWKYGKWFPEIPEITQPGTYTLNPVSQSPYACYKIPSPFSSTEYFMVEYRKKEGFLEGGIPSEYNEGLIIYRINTQVYSGNAQGPPDELYVYRPDGDPAKNGDISKASFSSNTNRIAFSNVTNPSCFLSNGDRGWIDISNITSTGNEISFTINLVHPLPRPQNFSAATQNNQVLLKWETPIMTDQTLLGYNVFLEGNNSPINTALITETKYLAPSPGQKTAYVFKLVAVYQQGRSDPVSCNFINTINSSPEWINYTDGKNVYSTAIEGDIVWIGTWGGLVKLNKVTGETTFYNRGNSGLPDNWVWSIAIDGSGNKWIGTWTGGLAKFDGTNWTVYNKLNSGLPDNGVLSIAIDKSNHIWLGTAGLAKFDGTNWTVYNPSNSGLPSYSVQSVAIDGSGNKWIGTNGGGLAKFDGTTWKVYDPSNSKIPSNIIQAVEIDDSGNKWIGTMTEGLAKFDDTNWTVFSKSNSGMPSDDVRSIKIDRSGNKWIGTHGGGLTKFDDRNWVVYNTSNSHLPNNSVFSLAIDGSGNKWVGTINGLTRFDDTTWKSYNTSNSNLYSNWLMSLAIDSKGNKWIGTDAWGLVKFDGTNWTVYALIQGYPSIGRVRSIAITGSGDVWIGGDGGLARFDGTNWTVFNTSNSGLPDNTVTSIVIDISGKIWCGTYLGGLAKFDGTNWTVFNTSNSGLPNNFLLAIAIDGSGNKWIGTVGGGLAKFDDKNWTIYNSSNSGLPVDYIKAITIDAFDNKWIGTGYVGLEIYGGLAKFDGTNWTVYNSSNSGLPYNFVESIAIDGEGNKWIGSSGDYFWKGGLTKFDGTNWTVYNTLNSHMPSSLLHAIAIDGFGNKWIATGHGLAVYNEGGVISTMNPVFAFAGEDQSVQEGTTVILDGSTSSAPNGNPLTYKWIAPPGITLSSTTAAKPTFLAPEVSQDTPYTFSLVVNDGTSDSAPAIVIVTVLNVTKVGISNLETPFFKVYPNPTTGIINVDISGEPSVKTSISVLSLFGAEVFRKEITDATSFQIDLSDRVVGVYLLKITSNNQQYNSKIVIQKE